MYAINNQFELECLVNNWVGARLERSALRAKLDKKIDDLAAYLKQWKIESVVVGVSGGVDSALVLAMLNEVAKRQQLSIFAETITYTQYHGIFQPSAIDILKESIDDPDGNIMWNTSNIPESVESEFIDSIGIDYDFAKRTRSQMNYAMRYLAFFTIADHVGGITIGTTNKDEFDYIGWFGKSSDMMVDVQPILDLHKFEVRALASFLHVPQNIVWRSPVGDLIDRSTDEENFGCTYNELAFYVQNRDKIETTDFIVEKFMKVEELHLKNAHKYQGQKFNPVRI